MTNSSHGRSLNTPAGYSGEAEYGRRTLSSKVYVGKIKDNRDVLSMGRLKVWIRDLDPDEDHEAGWQTVSYCSPFAGATPIRNRQGKITGSSNTFEDTQKTYGWWGVPPDLDNLVLCVFADGQQTQGFWIGCIFQEQMNQMVPAIGTDDNKEPKAEYNRADAKAASVEGINRAPDRPEHTTLKEGLRTQGLLIVNDKIDFDRGLATASSKRKFDHGLSESPHLFTGHRDQPAKTYGFLSPGGTQFVFDDLEGSEYVRLRTKTGAGITIHEGTGFIYIINKDGSAWVELAADGNIDVWSNISVNVRATQDINLRADRDINIESGRNINMKAIGEIEPGNIKIQCANDMDTTIGNDSRINVKRDHSVEVGVDIFERSINRNIRSTSTMRIQAGAGYARNSASFDSQVTGSYHSTIFDTMTLNVGGSRFTNTGGVEIKWAGGGIGWSSPAIRMLIDSPGGGGSVDFGNAVSPEDPELAIVPITNQKINIDFDAASKTYIEEKKTTIVTRFTTHEPFPDHIRKASVLEIPTSIKTGDSGLKPGSTSLSSLIPNNVSGSITPGGAIGTYLGVDYLGNQPLYELAGPAILASSGSLLPIGTPGLDLIIQKEGFLAFAQPDVGGGKSIIGFSHTLSLNELRTGLINIDGVNHSIAGGLSESLARDLLNQDVATRFAPVIDQNVLVDLNQNQKDALVSFSYNVGETNFKNSTLLRKLNTGDYGSVTSEMMRRTYVTNASGVKEQFNGLITRRQAEAELFSS